VPFPIKYNISAEARSISNGNWRIGTGSVSKGPTSSTGFWNSLDPPVGGYCIYQNKASGGPSINVCSNDSELVSKINEISGNSYTLVSEALNYAASTATIFVDDGQAPPPIIADGLDLLLDSKMKQCYPGSGTTLYDLSGKGRSCSLSGTTVNASKEFVFAGQGERDGSPAGDFISLDTTATTTSPATKTDGVTYQWWMRFDVNQAQGHGIFHGSGTINHLEWRGNNTSGYWRTEAVTQNGYSFGASNTYGGDALNTWFNMAIVFANDEAGRPVRWYHNGSLFHTGSMTGGNNPSGEYFQPSSFGRATGSSSYLYAQSFYGRLGMLAIYDRSLTAAEVLENYNNTNGRY
jgi:hypothetical protein